MCRKKKLADTPTRFSLNHWQYMTISRASPRLPLIYPSFTYLIIGSVVANFYRPTLVCPLFTYFNLIGSACRTLQPTLVCPSLTCLVFLHAADNCPPRTNVGCYKENSSNRVMITLLFTDRDKRSPHYSGTDVYCTDWSGYLHRYGVSPAPVESDGKWFSTKMFLGCISYAL